MHIAVVGSVNMDMVIDVEYIPKPGETVAGESVRYFPGGKGANQGVAIAKLGGKVSMFTCVGDDSTGNSLIENFKENGVNTEHIRKVDSEPTGMALITVGSGDNSIVIVAGANRLVNVEYIKSVQEALLQSDMVVLQNEIPEETNQYVIDLFYKHNKIVIFNPAPARKLEEDIINRIHYLTPNEHEAEIIFGKSSVISEMLKKYPEKLIVTMGERGVFAGQKNGKDLNIPARRVAVVDTTGAGDTFNGAFAFMIASDADFQSALEFANIAASISIGKYGAQSGMPSYDVVVRERDSASSPGEE